MNIAESDSILVEARTCGSAGAQGGQGARKVAYKFTNAFHSLCLDKRDILLSEIAACEMLLKCTSDESDKLAVEKELSELRMALDLMP
jgi:hypothetical protein